MTKFYSAVLAFAIGFFSPAAHACNTSWSYTDATQRVVVCTNSNGTQESGLASNPVVQASVAAGHAIGLAPPAPPTSVQITSTQFPALNGPYPIDPYSQQRVQAVSLYISVNGKFPAGQATQSVADINGVMHLFPTTAEWQAFATAMGDFMAALNLGQTPSQPISIP